MNKTKIMLLQSYICVASASAAIITPALPHIERAYALSHGSIEWVVSIFLLGYVLGVLWKNCQKSGFQEDDAGIQR